MSDEDIPDRLSQSLRSIRGSAKRKRMEKMLSTDLSQSFDGRRLFSEPTSPAVGLGSRTNTYQGTKQRNLSVTSMLVMETKYVCATTKVANIMITNIHYLFT